MSWQPGKSRVYTINPWRTPGTGKIPEEARPLNSEVIRAERKLEEGGIRSPSELLNNLRCTPAVILSSDCL